MAQVIMLNTLARKQIAQLVVSLFPYVPRAAPLMEAALELLTNQKDFAPTLHSSMPSTLCQDELFVSSAAGGSDRPAKGQQQPKHEPEQQAAAAGGSQKGTGVDQAHSHMQQRMHILEQQVQQWWHVVQCTQLHDGEVAVA
jgi:hypothetical protein